MSFIIHQKLTLRITTLCILAVFGIFTWHSLPSDFVHSSNSITHLDSGHSGNWLSRLGSSEARSDSAIPNIVHYVWILKPNGDLSFQFKHFISIYSAILYLRPDEILVHTNAGSESISKAEVRGTYWTRKVLELSSVKLRQMDMPTHTRKDVKLEALEHISDFVRPGIMKEYGGIYLDFDAVPIRDLRPLRESGFNNVFGHELSEKVNNGVMLAKKGSQLMDIFDWEQHEVFDGEWITHSVHLLTSIAHALAKVAGEVLILERKAFNPDGVSYALRALIVDEPLLRYSSGIPITMRHYFASMQLNLKNP